MHSVVVIIIVDYKPCLQGTLAALFKTVAVRTTLGYRVEMPLTTPALSTAAGASKSVASRMGLLLNGMPRATCRLQLMEKGLEPAQDQCSKTRSAVKHTAAGTARCEQNARKSASTNVPLRHVMQSAGSVALARARTIHARSGQLQLGTEYRGAKRHHTTVVAGHETCDKVVVVAVARADACTIARVGASSCTCSQPGMYIHTQPRG